MFNLFDLEEQYRRLPHIKRDEVKKLLEWVLMQPHLPKITEHEALIFFYACDCRMEYAKQVIDLNYTCRTHFDEFFGNVDVESADIKQIRSVVASVPLQQRTPEGYLVVMSKLKDTDPAKFHFGNSVKLYVISQDKWFLENDIPKGLIIAIDMTGAKLGHILRINLLHLKKASYFLQEAIPTRLVGLHFLNATSLMDRFLAVIQPFLKKELLDMLHVHTTMDTFYKFVPREIVPKDFGGPGLEMKELEENFFQSLQESRFDIIEYSATHRVNEKLRPGKAKLGFIWNRGYAISQDKWFLENDIPKGLIIAIDMTGAKLGHILRINLLHLKKASYFLQEAIPTRLVGLHFLNATSLMDRFLAVIQPFLKKELLDMLHVHTTMDTFYKFVPREIVPKDFGGPGLEMKELEENFFQYLRESRFDIIEYSATHRVNEKLRPAKAKLNSDLFGTEGNFKKLDID